MSGTIKSYKISDLTGSNVKGRVIPIQGDTTSARCEDCYFNESPLACPTDPQERGLGLESCSSRHHYVKVEKA